MSIGQMRWLVQTAPSDDGLSLPIGENKFVVLQAGEWMNRGGKEGWHWKNVPVVEFAAKTT